MREIAEAQRKMLEQFRSNLQDVLSEDDTDDILIKWLRAKNFNLRKAEKIFRVHYFTKVIFEINSRMDTYQLPEVARIYETIAFLGSAKDGSLLQYTAAGRLDLYGFIMSLSCFQICLRFGHMMEYAIRLQKENNLRTGRNVKEITFIIDLEGLAIQQVMHQCVIEMGLDYISAMQDCYPEIWSMMLIVNAPTIFDKAFNIFKPALRSTAFEKLKVAGKDSTKDLLLQYVDENVLPAFLGGQRVDSKGDPECKEFISFGGKIPETFYNINRTALLSPSDPGVKEIFLRPRSTYMFTKQFNEGGYRIRIEHRSENGSLIFHIFHKEFGPEPSDDEVPISDECLDQDNENCKYQQLCVTVRSQAHYSPDDFTMYLPWPGVYVLRYSNPSSWFSSRKIIYRMTILPPEFNSSS